MTSEKQCATCRTVKPVAAFSKNKSKPDGLQHRCRECVRAAYVKSPEKTKARSTEWRKANPEKAAANKASWYAANTEKAKADAAQWFAANNRHAARTRAAYYAENKDRLALAYAKWKRDNAGLVRAYGAKRKALKLRAVPAWVDFSAIAAVYEKAAQMRALGVDVHVDHIVPLQGKNVCGLHVHNNLQLLLASDNLSKGNKMAIA